MIDRGEKIDPADYSHPALTEWHLRNFKSVTSARLKLSPLTLFTGTNSSGKSTVLQSILALAQSLTRTTSVGEDYFLLNGPLVELGRLDDVVHMKSLSRSFHVGFSVQLYVSEPYRDATHCDVTYEIAVYSDVDKHASPLGSVTTYRTRHSRRRRTKNALVASPSEAHPETLDTIPDLSHLDIELVGTGDTGRRLADYRIFEEHGLVRSVGDELLASEFSTSQSPQDVLVQNELRRLRSETHLMRNCRPIGGEPADSDRIFEFRLAELAEKFDVNVPFVAMTQERLLPNEIICLYDARIRGFWHWVCALLTHGVAEVDLRTELSAFSFVVDEFTANELRAVDSKWAVSKCSRGLREMVLGALQRVGDEGRSDEVASTLQSIVDFLVPLALEKRRLVWSALVEDYVRLAKGYKESYPELPGGWAARVVPVGGPISNCNSLIVDYFQQHVRYLGPLRTPPAAVYPRAHVTMNYVGSKGESAVSILVSHDDPSLYSPTPRDDGSPGERTQKLPNLVRATLTWLRYLDVCTDLKVRDLGRPGVELLLKTSSDGPFHDLGHCGVGVSQVLPVVVQGLIARPGDLLLFEQPELHLHPAVQARLGDFFLALARCGIQCIVETHSEHLVDRLRLRIAASSEDNLADLMSLYFVEKEGGMSVFRRLDVDKYGGLVDWPKDFFDQSTLEAEAILRAAIKKKRREMN